MKRIVTRGDDAGSCKSADLALLDCARGGVLKNIGIMAPGPSFDHAISVLKDLKGVAFGLHVCLNAEWETVKWGPVLPASQVPTLVEDDGAFTQNPDVLRDRGFSVEEAMVEVKAQLDKVRKAGIEVTYLDEHMGISWIGFRDELAALCRSEGLVDHATVEYLDWYQTDLLSAVKAAPDGAYVVVNHPGFDAPDMQEFNLKGEPKGVVAKEREADRLLWLSPTLHTAVAEGVFQPIRYDEA